MTLVHVLDLNFVIIAWHSAFNYWIAIILEYCDELSNVHLGVKDALAGLHLKAEIR